MAHRETPVCEVLLRPEFVTAVVAFLAVGFGWTPCWTGAGCVMEAAVMYCAVDPPTSRDVILWALGGAKVVCDVVFCFRAGVVGVVAGFVPVVVHFVALGFGPSVPGVTTAAEAGPFCDPGVVRTK